jgi:20S proteasome alpha/beta subunit
MTVIAAAICRKENAVVLAADRAAVLQTDGGPLLYDTPGSKIHVLRSGVAVAVAGGSEDGLAIIRRIGGMGLAEIPAWIRGQRQDRRAKYIEEISQNDIRARAWLQHTQQDPLMRQLVEHYFLGSNNWHLSFLVAGVDEAGPHLWTVTEAGVDSHDTVGFAAIGAGANKAEFSLGRWTRDADKELPLAVYAAFEAKKDAERTPGVNDKTDLVILRKGTEPLSWEVDGLEPLEDVYGKMRPDRLTAELRQQVQDLIDRKIQSAASD